MRLAGPGQLLLVWERAPRRWFCCPGCHTAMEAFGAALQCPGCPLMLHPTPAEWARLRAGPWDESVGSLAALLAAIALRQLGVRPLARRRAPVYQLVPR